MGMSELYQEIILDHARSPHHAGLREPFDAESHQVNPTCGDEVTLRIRLRPGVDGSSVVDDISYDAVGCSISQASISVMADLVIGETLERAGILDAAFESMVKSKGTDAGDEEMLGDGVAFAGVSQYANRVKCALLGWKALMQAAQLTVASKTASGAPDLTGVARDRGNGDNGNHE